MDAVEQARRQADEMRDRREYFRDLAAKLESSDLGEAGGAANALYNIFNSDPEDADEGDPLTWPAVGALAWLLEGPLPSWRARSPTR